MSEAVQAGMSELQKRILSAIALGIAAIAATIWGGWPYQVVWTVAASCVAYEWQRIVHGGRAKNIELLTVTAVVLAALGTVEGAIPLALVGALGMLLALVMAPSGRKLHTGAGYFYAAGLGAAAILCRSTGFDGAIVIFWLFAVVWGTDTLAYFTGRALGGPKLWPRVSPKKTWSGAIGGLVGGVALGCLLLTMLGVSPRWQHVALSIVFSVLTQCGDLFESALKRRYDVKDSSNLIPGHGGFMDRLDGFIFAVIAAALIGGMRAGATNVPKGLLAWT